MPTPAIDSTERTVSSRVARNLLTFAVSHGADREALLAEAGIDEMSLDDLEGRISAVRHGRLWNAAADASSDPDFGLHYGARSQPEDVSLVSFVIKTAPTLGNAFDAVARYFNLFSEGLEVRLDTGGSGREATLELRPVRQGGFEDASRHPTESILSTLARLSRSVTGRRLPGVHVAFAHSRPTTGTVAHERVFGVVPTFGADVSRLSFDSAALKWPGCDASPNLHATLRDQADEMLAQLHPSIPTSVARAVAERFRGGVPTLADVANDLAMGERSLQRHLEESGVTFLGVVNEVRREMALRYLDSDHATLHEIAFALGFSEPSAFHRAFKRWTGMTAGAYRKSKESA